MSSQFSPAMSDFTCKQYSLLNMQTKDGITVLSPLKPHTLYKYVHNSDMFTTLYVVVLVSRFPRSLPLSPLQPPETLLCPNKGCKQHQRRPDWMFSHITHSALPTSPITIGVALSAAPLVFLLQDSIGVFPCMLRISPEISNYPPLTDCSVSLAACRLDLMFLRLQCKRIVVQFSWRTLCLLQLNWSHFKT